MSKKDNDWKKRLGMVYSTNPDYQYEQEGEGKQATLPPEQQDLRVKLEKKGRKGKIVTLITGFKGDEEDLQELGKLLKKQCGTGGSAKEGEIILQGDVRDTVLKILTKEGYPAKKSGG